MALFDTDTDDSTDIEKLKKDIAQLKRYQAEKVRYLKFLQDNPKFVEYAKLKRAAGY